jgi:hypothetical protein
MKKLLLISLIVLPFTSNAQFKQGVGSEYYQNNFYVMREVSNIGTELSEIEFEKGDFAALYKLQYKIKSFKIESFTSIYMNKDKSYQFAPTHAEFTIKASYIIKDIKIEVSHMCVHPLIVGKDRGRSQLTGANTKIGIYYNFD